MCNLANSIQRRKTKLKPGGWSSHQLWISKISPRRGRYKSMPAEGWSPLSSLAKPPHVRTPRPARAPAFRFLHWIQQNNAAQFGQILGFLFVRLFLPSSRSAFCLSDLRVSAGNLSPVKLSRWCSWWNRATRLSWIAERRRARRSRRWSSRSRRISLRSSTAISISDQRHLQAWIRYTVEFFPVSCRQRSQEIIFRDYPVLLWTIRRQLRFWRCGAKRM